MDVNILVHSPYIVVPENGTLTEYVHFKIMAHYAHMLTTVTIHIYYCPRGGVANWVKYGGGGGGTDYYGKHHAG